ncbi:MAG: DUF3320 domain-containing protein [Bullifex sp.]
MTERRSYVTADLPVLKLSPEDVFSHVHDDELQKRISKIISVEAPIRDTLLRKRLLNSISLKRCGSRLDDHISALISGMDLYMTEEDEPVYHSMPYTGYDHFRTSPESDRYSYQIPVCEAECALSWCLENTKGMMYRKQLLSAFTSALLYERKGAAIEALFEAALRAALRDEIIKESGNHKFFI